MKNGSKKKSRKKWLWIILAILIALGIIYLILSKGMRSKMSQTFYSSYTVSTGSVEVSSSGSGKLAAAEVEKVNLPEGIKIAKVLVEAGDVIDEGQVLAELDTDSLQNKVASLTEELSALDRQLTQMNDNKTTEYVYSPVKGRIKYIAVEEGDEVISSIAEHGALAILSTDGKMNVQIKTDTALELYTEVTVKWDDGEKKGKIAAKIADGYLITLTDKGTPYCEDASVYDGETLLGNGSLQINKPISVYANGGTIDKIHYKENTNVGANIKLFTLDNEPLSSNYQQIYSQRRELADQLESVIAYLETPYVTAENKGTVSEVLISEGSTTGGEASGTASSTSMGGTASSNGSEAAAFVINNSGSLQMTIAVDELDIGSISLDQTAEVTLDAISSETFEAAVSRISYLGAASGSITTYNVDLTLENDERFLAGMNGNATIIIDKAEDALLVPIEAINEDASGIYVYVSQSGAADGSDRQRRDITTGLSDGEYAQVTDGLSKGDIILYVKAGSSNTMFPGMMGGMPEGMPDRNSGGMPDRNSGEMPDRMPGGYGNGGDRSGN